MNKHNYTVTFKERFGFYKTQQKFQASGHKIRNNIIEFLDVGEHNIGVQMIYHDIKLPLEIE